MPSWLVHEDDHDPLALSSPEVGCVDDIYLLDLGERPAERVKGLVLPSCILGNALIACEVVRHGEYDGIRRPGNTGGFMRPFVGCVKLKRAKTDDSFMFLIGILGSRSIHMLVVLIRI
jgi:hypothetical protein